MWKKEQLDTALHSPWNYMKREVHILCDPPSHPAKKKQFFSAFRRSHKWTTRNTGMKLCVWIFNTILFHLKRLLSPFTLILSVQTHSVCWVGKCHLLRVTHICVCVLFSWCVCWWRGLVMEVVRALCFLEGEWNRKKGRREICQDFYTSINWCKPIITPR